MRRTLTGAIILAGVVLSAPAAHSGSQQKPQIVDFAVSSVADGLAVSFRVESAITEDSLERIASGMEVEFRHRIELLVRRSIPVWPARVLSRMNISVSVHYDSLTRQYHLTRSIEREIEGKTVESDEGVEELLTPSEGEAHEWMTRIGALILNVPAGEVDDRVRRLHVRSWLGRRYRFYLFPMADAAEAEQEIAR